MATIRNATRVHIAAPQRFSDDHDDVIGPAYQAVWRDLSRYASSRRYHHNGVEVAIKMDWSVIARHMLDDVRTFKRPGRMEQGVDVPTVVVVKGSDVETVNRTTPSSIICYHIANVFLAMNLAAPGCASFQHCRTADGSPLEVDLVGTDFELAWIASLGGVQPPISSMPLEQCFKWLAPLEQRFVSVARSQRERVAVSLLQLAGMECSPQSAIWIWYSLETLFRTVPGSVFNQVRDQMCRVVGANDSQVSMLGHSLRPLYRLRSEFTHGKLPIIHPHFVDPIGTERNAEMDQYADAHNAGIHTLLACAQALARRA